MSELNLTHSNGNKVKLTTPDTLAANKTFKLPGADGSTGQFLKTDGSGALSFATVDTTIANGSITADKLATGVGGKIIQFAYKSGGVTTSNNSGGWTDSVETGHNVNITPIASNSILVVQMYNVGGNNQTGRSYFLRLRRKINNTNDTNVANFQTGDANGGGMEAQSLIHIDVAPSGGWNTSHVVNYRTRFGQDGSGTARYGYTTTPVLMVFEVAT
tara:strand:+ start:666 stop:1313 length:648 start_codon:yes stop_codon:yes gene_type:complete